MNRPTGEQLREYAQRPWAAMRDTVRAQAPDKALECSQMLWEHMREVDPQWPDADQRHTDLEHHRHLVHLSQRLADVGFPR